MATDPTNPHGLLTKKRSGIITRLLPQSSLFPRLLNNMGKFFKVLDEMLDEVLTDAEGIYLDMLPTETTNREAWAEQFSIASSTVEALEAVWKEHRDMSPQHIEDRLRAAGYNATIYDWWVPGSDPKVPRPVSAADYFLVDGKRSSTVTNEMRIGDSIASVGDSRALVGYHRAGDPTRIVYSAPSNDRGVIYIKYIDNGNRDGFEELVLKIVPSHLWIGVINVIPGAFCYKFIPLPGSEPNTTGAFSYEEITGV